MSCILIIEDDYKLNRGLCKALQNKDTRIIPCLDMRTAKEQLLLISPSLIILDVNLPDGNGIEFLKEIKQHSPSVPVILLTANDTDLEIVQGLEAGADDIVTQEDSFEVLTDPSAYTDVDDALRKAGYELVESEVEYVPSMESTPNENDLRKLKKLVMFLEDNDDVQSVNTNCSIPLDDDEE